MQFLFALIASVFCLALATTAEQGLADDIAKSPPAKPVLQKSLKIAQAGTTEKPDQNTPPSDNPKPDKQPDAQPDVNPQPRGSSQGKPEDKVAKRETKIIQHKAKIDKKPWWKFW